MQISKYQQFKNLFKNQNFSQIYISIKNINVDLVEQLINIIAKKKDSFIFEFVEKIKFRGRYTIFGFNSDKTININKNIEILSKKKKNTKNKSFFF